MLERVSIPEGKMGAWEVSRFVVSDEDAQRQMFQMMKTGRYTPPGEYTKLTRSGYLVMSDTPDEMRDHYEIVRQASGHVLINGLGIGMVLRAVLKKPEVKRVTVVEKSADVIALVGPSYASERVEIVHADAFDYQPPKGVRYGAVWHDIWDDICGDNLAGMTKLKRSNGR